MKQLTSFAHGTALAPGIAVGFLLLLNAMTLVPAAGGICLFTHLTAECRYQIDGVSMSLITTEIQPCNQPVDVTFRITNDNPHVDWTYAFKRADELQTVAGFDVNVELRVALSSPKENSLRVQADFYVEGSTTVFMDSEVELITAYGSDTCSLLSPVGTVVLAVILSLVLVSLAIAAILGWMYWRRKQSNHAASSTLMLNMSSHSVASNGTAGRSTDTPPVRSDESYANKMSPTTSIRSRTTPVQNRGMPDIVLLSSDVPMENPMTVHYHSPSEISQEPRIILQPSRLSAMSLDNRTESAFNSHCARNGSIPNGHISKEPKAHLEHASEEANGIRSCETRKVRTKRRDPNHSKRTYGISSRHYDSSDPGSSDTTTDYTPYVPRFSLIEQSNV